MSVIVEPQNKHNPIQKNDHSVQRALIFQGGGALGAYEAGIYKALYDNLNKTTIEEKRQLFDIISGTSAGAINAVIIVNHVLQNRGESNPWDGSVERLCQYWKDVSTDTWCVENPLIRSWA